MQRERNLTPSVGLEYTSRHGVRARRKRALTPWTFLTPALIIMGAVILYPLVEMIVLSFREEIMVSPTHPFVGLQNYLTLNALVNIPTAAWNTLLWTVGSMAGQCMLGFAAALALNTDFHGSRLIRALLLTPWVTSPVVAAVVWGWMTEPTFGVIDTLLHSKIAWLSSPHLAMISLIGINVWLGFPFWMIMLTSALKTVPRELYEAAYIDGANGTRQFFHVTLPSIRVVFELTTLLAFIFTTNSFGLMQLLTGGGPGSDTTTIPYAIYNLAFVQEDLGAAAALSVIFSILMAGIVIVYFRMLRRSE